MDPWKACVVAYRPFVFLVDADRPRDVVAGSGKSVLSYVSPISYFQRAHVGS
jgi:hypothetical protein